MLTDTIHLGLIKKNNKLANFFRIWGVKEAHKTYKAVQVVE